MKPTNPSTQHHPSTQQEPSTRRRTSSSVAGPATSAVLIIATWASMISFGGVLAETVMLYPNIFRDPPESLTLAREFIVAGSPSDFFPPLGATVILSCLAASVLTWRIPSLRRWTIAATAVFLCCEFLFSAYYFWPRNTVMFVDPVGTHSASELREVAAEFSRAHWVRVIGGGVTSGLLFTALLRWTRRPTAPRT